MPTLEPATKDCQNCHEVFEPRSNNQKWCDDCIPEMRRRSHIRSQQRSRSSSYAQAELLNAADSVLNMPTRGGTVDARRPEFTRLLDAVEASGA